MLKPGELDAFVETARRFAGREVAPMLKGETRDGDLAALPGILEKAETAGLLASSNPESPGHEFGVWGRACLEQGPSFSIALLKEISKACAGVAACLHFAGLGALESPESTDSQGAAVALFEDHWRLTWRSLREPPPGAAHLRGKNGAHFLEGAKFFVNAAPRCGAFVVFAADDSGWQRVQVPVNAPGLSVSSPGPRTGLAALDAVHLRFDRTPVEDARILPSPDAFAFVTRLFLGLSAVCLGNAAGALESAREYAAERYQGGDVIETHPAVLGLLGDAFSRVWACEAHLEALAEKGTHAEGGLRQAAGARLRIGMECCRAVTDCMQVLGGYGYMEDFRVEKRLRDALTLKTMCVRPDDLRMLCCRTEPGGAEHGV